MEELRIAGKVIKGKRKGKELGFPTANIKIDQKIENGVYAGKAWIKNQEYRAAVFVPENVNYIEVHILNFHLDIYKEDVRVVLGKKIREVKKFGSDKELKKQIRRDIKIINQNN